MIFNSFSFLFLFLPISLLLYYTVGRYDRTPDKRIQKGTLILLSLFFYSMASPAYLVILLCSVAFNYLCACYIHHKPILIVGIAGNLLLLAYFKYMDFFLDTINTVMQTDYALHHILLPLGISFFTFQQVAYLIDCYRTDSGALSFLDYVLSVTFFPKIAEGPMITPGEFVHRMQEHEGEPVYENLNRGFYLLGIGLVKKVVLADFIARFPNAGFGMEHLSMIDAWITSLGYTLQLYFDFSGYCDMAVGISLMFGFHLPFNFNSPYKACNIQDFWKRWHITLSAFLTKYVYIPLGGSRKGTVRTYVNIFLVFLISGFWHGAGWTFVLWGALHGISSIVYRMWHTAGKKMPAFCGWFLTLNCVNLFWVFFRADSLTQAWQVIRSMFALQTLPRLLSNEYFTAIKSLTPQHNKIAMGLFAVGLLITLCSKNSMERLQEWKPRLLTMATMLLFLILGVLCIASQMSTSSLYFNF
ncbi:MAG: MBOAT family O-acyltransferase [Lachnospiraceae bacterium]